MGESLLKGDELAPAQGVQLGAVDGVAEVVEGAVRDEGDERVLAIRHAHDPDQLLRHVHVRHLIRAPDVEDLPHLIHAWFNG